MKTILLISPYWKEPHRWMASSLKFAELWQRLGYRVVVACMASETRTEQVSDTLTIYRFQDFFLKDPLNFGIRLGFTRSVKKIIRNETPDLIVINKVLFWTSFSLIPLRLAGYKVLLVTDALVGITWKARGVIPRIIMSIGAWTVGWLVLLCANRIVFFHPQPESVLKRLGIQKKSQVIPTGIDVAKFEVPSAKFQGKEEVIVTYVGRLESVKGVDDFLAAAAPLTKDYPQLKVQVVGWYPSPSSGQALHPLVKHYSNDVTFTGLRDDIPNILAASDIFVLPSYSEGLSNALMEAMASGCACIATEVGGNSYLVQNGVSGLLFPPGDREALRAHIKRLLDDPAKRKAMGEAARKRIEEQFSWEKVGKMYGDLFMNY